MFIRPGRANSLVTKLSQSILGDLFLRADRRLERQSLNPAFILRIDASILSGVNFVSSNVGWVKRGFRWRDGRVQKSSSHPAENLPGEPCVRARLQSCRSDLAKEKGFSPRVRHTGAKASFNRYLPARVNSCPDTKQPKRRVHRNQRQPPCSQKCSCRRCMRGSAKSLLSPFVYHGFRPSSAGRRTNAFSSSFQNLFPDSGHDHCWTGR